MRDAANVAVREREILKLEQKQNVTGTVRGESRLTGRKMASSEL